MAGKGRDRPKKNSTVPTPPQQHPPLPFRIQPPPQSRLPLLHHH